MAKAKHLRHLLKALQTREAALKTEMEVLVTGAGNAVRMMALREELATVQKRLKGLVEKAREPFVTEHALLRYLERVKGVDLDELEREILTPERTAMIKNVPNCDINVHGIKFIVRDGAVITAREA